MSSFRSTVSIQMAIRALLNQSKANVYLPNPNQLPDVFRRLSVPRTPTVCSCGCTDFMDTITNKTYCLNCGKQY